MGDFKSALGSAAEKQPRLRRGIDRARHRHAVHHFGDVHGEFAIGGKKFPRAVQRIDQEKLPPGLGDAPGGGFLFRHHRYARKGGGETGQDQSLGFLVGVGDGRAVGLEPGIAAGQVMAHDDRTGLGCDLVPSSAGNRSRLVEPILRIP